MEYHRYADLFPMMNDEEFKVLVEDMRSGGYDERFPIITFENKILDGRNRYKASIEANVNPKYEEFTGENALDFVIRSNLKRRQLTQSQKAAIAVMADELIRELSTEAEKREKSGKSNPGPNLAQGRVSRKLSEIFGVSTGYIKDAKKLRENEPKIFEQVLDGLNINDAKSQVKEKERKSRRKEAEKAGKKIKSSSELWKIIHGDMRIVGSQIPNNSVDIILTDPPYPEDFLYCWDALSELANRVLKPSGFVFAYSGQLHLPDAMTRLSTHLNYYWTMSLEHTGNNQLIMPRNVFCGWKPILIYQKSPFKRFEDKFSDFIQGSGREKGLHDWQQGEGELDYIINTFTLPGQTILDPFCGSGTTLIASIKSKRYAIGIEIEEENYLISKQRLSQ